MKILLVSPLPPPSGGMARWTQLYLSGAQDCELSARLVNTAVSQKRAARDGRAFMVADELLRTLRVVTGFVREMRSFSPDIVHICSSCSRFGMLRDYVCVRLSGKTPVVFHCHCNVADQVGTGWGKRLLRAIAKRCGAVFVLNRTSQAFVEQIAPGKTALVPNFIEDQPAAAEPVIRDSIETAVFVGHVKRSKGIAELFEAAKLSPDIRFLVIGPVQELPREDAPANLTLTGELAHDDVLRAMSQADVFVFPSHTEGFANVMLEAMAAGLPIVATDVGANRDMIEDRGGVIVPVGDPGAIQRALREMASSELRSSMSRFNLRKARESYALPSVMRTIRSKYRELIP